MTQQISEQPSTAWLAAFSTLINGYCREFRNWSVYEGIPEYDEKLAVYFSTTGHRLHLRFDFSTIGLEVFAPLHYFSQSGHHSCGFPVAERDLATDEIKEIDPARFATIISSYAKAEYPELDATVTRLYLQQNETAYGVSPETVLPGRSDALSTLYREGIWEQPPAIIHIIRTAAAHLNKPEQPTAKEWFHQLLQLYIRPLMEMLNGDDHGRAFQQEELLVTLDSHFFPANLHRAGTPQEAILPTWMDQWTDVVLVRDLLPVIGTLGRYGLADETTLIDMVYTSLEAVAPEDHTGLVSHLLHSHHLRIKSGLLTSLHPDRAHVTVYRSYPNPLHQRFFSKALIHPEGKGAVYSRYFPKEDIVVSIRPFDINRDLEMVHEWFHREHARKIWKMDWPLRELETYYRTMLPGHVAHSYIGEINGEPSYNFEVYWVVRDLLSGYYDALPTDYGTHQFIASTDPKKKYASPSTQCMLDWVFAQPEVGKMVGEGSVESLAALMNKAHVGFKIEKVIELPHKKANLNFCYREWYWAKFPESQP